MSSMGSDYEVVLYPTRAQWMIHPDRMAAVALLYGVRPPAFDRCRILEIGCGDGSNLIPMAAALPGASLVGLDLSLKAIDAGRERVATCGLTNLDLRCGALEAVDASWGRFDYILAHGVYSWVAPAVREALWRVCRERLASDGLAVISFNALPGGHARQALREMFLWHVRGVQEPLARLAGGRQLGRLLAEETMDVDPFGALIRSRARELSAKDDGLFYHDELEAENTPFYAHEFAAAAAAAGLQVIADAEPADLILRCLSGRARESLKAVASDRLQRDQYVDFLTNRAFRKAVLCRAEVEVGGRLDPCRVDDLFVSMPAAVLDPSAMSRAGAPARFAKEGQVVFKTEFSPGKALLSMMAGSWPRRFRVAELMDGGLRAARTWDKKSPEVGVDQVREWLLDACGHGALFLHATAPGVPADAGERPEAHPWVRWEAEQGELVTSLFHQVTRFEDPLLRTVLASMDGTRNRGELRKELAKAVRGLPAVATAWKRLDADFDGTVGKLCAAGFLRSPPGRP